MGADHTPRISLPERRRRATAAAPVTFDTSSGEIDLVWFKDLDVVLRDHLHKVFIEQLHPEWLG